MMDVVELAKEAVVVLSPAIPYLTKGGGQALEEVSKKMTAAALEQATALWSKITSSSGKAGEEVKKAAKDVGDDPADSDAQAAFRLQLKKLFKEDKELLSEIEQIISKEKASIMYNKGVHISGLSTVIAGDIVGGDQVFGK